MDHKNIDGNDNEDVSGRNIADVFKSNDGANTETQCPNDVDNFRNMENSDNHTKYANHTKKFGYEQCNYYTYNSHILSRHIKIVSNKIKDYQSVECDYATGDKRNLQKHMKNIHNIFNNE